MALEDRTFNANITLISDRILRVSIGFDTFQRHIAAIRGQVRFPQALLATRQFDRLEFRVDRVKQRKRRHTDSNVFQHIGNMLPPGFFITFAEFLNTLQHLIHQLDSRDPQHHRPQWRNSEGKHIQRCLADLQKLSNQ